MVKFIRLKILPFVFLMVFVSQVFPQYYDEFGEEIHYDIYKLPTVEVSLGYLSFFGDVSDFNKGVSLLGRHNLGYGINIQQRLGNYFGVSLGGMKGTLSGFDSRPGSYHNFKTDVIQGDFNIYLHFDNNLIASKSARFSPYIRAGIGYIKFDPMGDLHDKNGKRYHYWKDGTIRDQAFDIENPQNGNLIVRDYVFETTLDSLNLFDKSALVVPIGVGFKFKLSDLFETNLAMTYVFSNTNYIDNLSFEGKSYPFFDHRNDNYMYSSVSLQFNIGGYYKRVLNNRPYRNINFAEIDAMDSDGDGVPDHSDRCPDTPKGVKVDAFGCPLDDDGDGVPNYLDKEPNTAPGALVDEHGVTITPEMIEAKFIRDSLIMAGELILHKTYSSGTPIITEDYDLGGSGTEFTHYSYPYVPANWPENVTYVSVNTSGTRSRGRIHAPTTTTGTSAPATVALSNVNTGTFYRVQIGASQKPLDESFFKERFNVKEDVRIEQSEGWYRYTIGNFPTYKTARDYARMQSSIEGAFVVKFEDGKRVMPTTPQLTHESTLPTATETYQTTTQPTTQQSTEGVYFRVQIGASSNKLTEGFFKQNFGISENIFEELHEGQHKYTIGHFKTYKEARSYAAGVTSVQGAFVTAYRDGVRISLQDALR